MKEIIIVVLIIASVLIISGWITATSATIDKTEKKTWGTFLDVYTKCDDRVICYFHSGGYSGGMDCFRDADLIEKYCSKEHD